MSIELENSLDESQRALGRHHQALHTRHVRLMQLFEGQLKKLKATGADLAIVEKFRSALKRADLFYETIVLDSCVLGEERNFYYFSMQDLEEILFKRNKHSS